MKESTLAAAIRLAVSKLGARLFRNQVGTYHLADPRCKWCAKHGRKVGSGLGKGSPDLVGWRVVTITPDMVGQRVAVFIGIEVKASLKRATAEQQSWLAAIRESGGIAGVARSVDEARDILFR